MFEDEQKQFQKVKSLFKTWRLALQLNNIKLQGKLGLPIRSGQKRLM
jgi:hypothetical protein